LRPLKAEGVIPNTIWKFSSDKYSSFFVGLTPGGKAPFNASISNLFVSGSRYFLVSSASSGFFDSSSTIVADFLSHVGPGPTSLVAGFPGTKVFADLS
jgi:hypothetical protein